MRKVNVSSCLLLLMWNMRIFIEDSRRVLLFVEVCLLSQLKETFLSLEIV